MGSYGWTYFVPYQRSIEKALSDLHAEIRRSGQFLGAEGAAEADDVIDILLRQGYDGTHSALDIIGISETPMICHASPFDETMLLEFFSTLKPTREQIEAKESDLNEPIERGEARYVIVYKDGRPSEIYFSGNTGD